MNDDHSGADGFDAFFFVLLPRVLRLAERLTGERASAEDVAAEAFARAFARWPRLRDLSYREAWVLRVASNVAIDAFRRRRLPRPVEPEQVDPAEVVALRVSLVEALRALPKNQRQAIVLRYVADLPEDEVAAAMGVRPGTVKSHIHRARRTLEDRLGANPEEIRI